MLQRIRDRITGWIAGAIIAVIGSAFVFWGVSAYFGQGASNQNAATVNDVAVTHQQVQDYAASLQQEILAKNHGQPLSQAMQSELQSYALQSLITQTALLTTLEKSGFRIGLTQIEAMIEQAPQFQVNGQFSQTKFLSALSQMSVSPSQFFQRMQSQWVMTQVMNSLTASAFVLPDEVNHWSGVLNQQRAFGYLMIPVNNFLAKINVTDQAIQQYYHDNSDAFKTPAKVRVDYLMLSPTVIGKTITVSDAEAKNYYEAHVQNYQVPASWTVTEITVPVANDASESVVTAAQQAAIKLRSAIEAGTSFSAILKENPQLSHSTQTISAAVIDNPLRQTLSQLPINTLSQPLRTGNGFTVLKVLKSTPEKTHAFASVQAAIVQLIKRQKINDILTKQSSQLSDLTYTNPDSLTAAAQALHLPIQTSGLMTKAGEKTGIFSNPAVLAAMFSHSVYQSNNNSDPIDLKNGEQIVLRIKDKVPSELIPFAQVSEKIKTILQTQKASAQAGLLAYQLQEQLVKGANPEQLASQHGLQWHTVALTKETNTTAPKAVSAAAFLMPVGVKASLIDPDHYAVISVTRIATTAQKTISEHQKLRDALTKLWGELYQHYFVASVMNSSKIKQG